MPKTEKNILTQILETLPVMVFVKDVKNDFRFSIWNKGAEKIVGMPAEKMLGKNDYDFFPKEQADFFRQKDLETCKLKETLVIPEEELTTASGPKFLRTRKVVIRDNSGEAIYLLGVSEDITEIRNYQKLLEEAQRVAKIGSWSFLIDGRQVTWSKQMFKMFHHDVGVSPTYESSFQAVHPEDRERCQQAVEHSILSGKPFKIRARSIFEGKTLWLEITGEASKNELGKVVALNGTSQDITELVEAEDLAKVERARALQNARLVSLGEMSAGIAHEINNPLAIIAGSSFLIEKSNGDLEKIKKQTEVIKRACDRVSRIVNGLRKFSRSSSQSTYEPHSLMQLIREAIALTETKARRHDTMITLDGPEDIEIDCDEIEISQVFVNMINNAVEAIKHLSERWVKIKVAETLGNITVKISDSGSGLSPEVQKKIYEPFFTTKPVGEGTGLGMSIVKGILDEHQATIEIINEEPNTCFEIKFRRPESSSAS